MKCPRGLTRGRQGTYDIRNWRGWRGSPRETDKCRVGEDQITVEFYGHHVCLPQTVCSQLSRRHYNFCMKQLFFIRKLFLSLRLPFPLSPHTSCFPFLSEGTVDLGKGRRKGAPTNPANSQQQQCLKFIGGPFLALTFSGPLRGLFYVAWLATLEIC